MSDLGTTAQRLDRNPDEEPEPSEPIVAPTGVLAIDAATDVFNDTASAFTSPPPPEQGALGHANQIVGGTLGMATMPFQMLDMAVAGALAPIASLAPGLPAATLLAPHLGPPHTHTHPPSYIAPAPPIPMPSIGVVVAAGVLSVLVGNIPAAVAGDLGLAPSCGGYFPIFEVFTGSSNVFVGGARAARMLDITRHCGPAAGSFLPKGGRLAKAASVAMDVGLPAAGVAAGGLSAAASAAGGDALAAAVAAAQAAADAVAMAMALMLGRDPGGPTSIGALVMGNPTVLIGGLPLPPILDVFGGLLKALQYVGKAAGRAGQAAAESSAGQRMATVARATKSKVQHLKCKLVGEPVDPCTGVVVNEFVDIEVLEGAFAWTRHYRSDTSGEPGPFGPGFRHGLQHELVLHDDRAVLLEPDGDVLVFPQRKGGGHAPANGRTLEEDGAGRLVVRNGDTRAIFERTGPGRARLVALQGGPVDLRLVHAEGSGLLERIIGASSSEAFELAFTWFEERIVKLERVQPGGPRSSIARYEYGLRGELTRVIDAQGHTRRHRFDDGLRMVESRDKRGYAFYWAYDAQGRCIETRGQDDLWRTTLRYEPGRTFVTRGDGGEWVYLHTDEGEISTIIDPHGGIERFVRDDEGRVVSQWLPNGKLFAWLYDDDGRHFARIDPQLDLYLPLDIDPDPADPHGIRLPSSAMGWHWGAIPLELESPPNLGIPGWITAHLRGYFGAPVPPAEPGPTVRDPAGNVVARVDRDGRAWSTEIGSWNLPVAERDPLGHETRRRYDAQENPVAVIDAGGTEIRYEYDRCDRLVRVHRHGRQRDRYEYDAGGTLVAHYGARDRLLVRYEADDQGRHRVRRLASGDEHRFEYDRWGHHARAVNAHADARFFHDEAGNRWADLREGMGVEHGWEGNEHEGTRYFGRFVVRYARPDPHTLELVTPDGGRHRIRHGGDGQVLREHEGGARELSRFDASGRCVGKVQWRDGAQAPTWWARYEHSPEGELREVEDSARGNHRYEYDAAHRVIGEITPEGTRRPIRYDEAGNILRNVGLGEARYGAGNLLEQVDGEPVAHDDRDSVCRRGPWRFRHDSLDRLCEARCHDRVVWEAGHDALGRRVFKRSGDRRTEYWWDGSRLAAERDPEGRLRLYVYADAESLVPVLLVELEDLHAPPESAVVYTVYTDQLGTPHHVEDREGRVVWRALAVTPYGELEVDPASVITLDLRFPGHIFDEETGLHYNRFRYYDPRLGRYLESDPLGQAGGVNLHAYTSNPLARVDLLGLSPVEDDLKTKTWAEVRHDLFQKIRAIETAADEAAAQRKTKTGLAGYPSTPKRELDYKLTLAYARSESTSSTLAGGGGSTTEPPTLRHTLRLEVQGRDPGMDDEVRGQRGNIHVQHFAENQATQHGSIAGYAGLIGTERVEAARNLGRILKRSSKALIPTLYTEGQFALATLVGIAEGERGGAAAIADAAFILALIKQGADLDWGDHRMGFYGAETGGEDRLRGLASLDSSHFQGAFANEEIRRVWKRWQEKSRHEKHAGMTEQQWLEHKVRKWTRGTGEVDDTFISAFAGRMLAALTTDDVAPPPEKKRKGKRKGKRRAPTTDHEPPDDHGSPDDHEPKHHKKLKTNKTASGGVPDTLPSAFAKIERRFDGGTMPFASLSDKVFAVSLSVDHKAKHDATEQGKHLGLTGPTNLSGNRNFEYQQRTGWQNGGSITELEHELGLQISARNDLTPADTPGRRGNIHVQHYVEGQASSHRDIASYSGLTDPDDADRRERAARNIGRIVKGSDKAPGLSTDAEAQVALAVVLGLAEAERGGKLAVAQAMMMLNLIKHGYEIKWGDFTEGFYGAGDGGGGRLQRAQSGAQEWNTAKDKPSRFHTDVEGAFNRVNIKESMTAQHLKYQEKNDSTITFEAWLKRKLERWTRGHGNDPTFAAEGTAHQLVTMWSTKKRGH